MSGFEPIIFTKNNIVNTPAQNTFAVDFPTTINMKNKSIAIQSIIIPFSWFNITVRFANNTFSFTYPDGATNPIWNVVLPDGTYNITDLTNYIEFFCQQNGLYVIDGNGNNEYFFNFQVNSVRYSIQFNSIPVYTVLPVGYTLPANYPAGGLPTALNTNPQLIINEGISTFVGFSNGTYPTAPTYNAIYSTLGTFTPNINTISTVFVECNIANNKYNAQSSQVLSSFNTTGIQFGSYISYQPNNNNWINCSGQQKNTIRISFVDQDFEPVFINDIDATIIVLIRDD